MTPLTANVESIGPHPATRTELEARAAGHHEGKVKLDGFGNVSTEEGRCLWIMIDLEGPDLDHLRKAKDADANAAQSVLAWNSYNAMRDALQNVEWGGQADLPEGGHGNACPWCGALERDGEHNKECCLALALKAARGERQP